MILAMTAIKMTATREVSSKECQASKTYVGYKNASNYSKVEMSQQKSNASENNINVESQRKQQKY